MIEAFIFGSSGHARVIASILCERYDKINFIERDKTDNNIVEENSFFKNIEKYHQKDIYIGIGDNGIRRKIFNKLLALGITPKNCIANHAFVAKDAEIGQGVVICHGAVIGSKAKVGHNTIINTLSSIDHDCVLGDHSQVTAGVTFGGSVQVGTNCFVGLKSAIIPKITIGDNSTIMAGSVVYKDLPNNVMAGGNPARIIKLLG